MQSYLKFSRVIAALFVGMLVIACNNSTGSKDGILLNLKMKNDAKYEYAFNIDLDQQVAGQESKIKVGTVFTMVPTSVEDSSQTITATYDRFTMKMNMGGMGIDIDTDSPAGPMLSQEDFAGNSTEMIKRLFSGIKGKSVNMTVAADGELKDISGFREILQAMVDSMGLPEEQKGQMAASLNDQFSDASLKDQFGPFFKAFSNRVVNVGDTWDVDVITSGRMAAKYKSNYKVKDIKGSIVTLDVKSVISEASGELSGLTGDVTGTMVLDVANGYVTTGDLIQNFKMKVEGMDLDMKGKVTITGTMK